MAEKNIDIVKDAERFLNQSDLKDYNSRLNCFRKEEDGELWSVDSSRVKLQLYHFFEGNLSKQYYPYINKVHNQIKMLLSW